MLANRGLAAALLLSLSADAAASVFGRDDRLSISSDLTSSYAPIGIVWADRMATGFLVDRCHVLTVRHAFLDDRTAVGRKAVFGTPPKDQAHWTATWGTVVATGKRQPSDSYDQVRAADWALLRLRDCLGADFGYVELDPAPASDVGDVKSAGFPFDRRQIPGVTVDPSCRIVGSRSVLWLNDCAALAGSSGSPIFSETRSDGRTGLKVYAIQSAAYGVVGDSLESENSRANIATPVAVILPSIRKYLNFDRPARDHSRRKLSDALSTNMTRPATSDTITRATR
jgi:V8-like Glu-specific endopeptidase